jgi:7-carboxy-7-deazaguanine synthase
VNSYPVAEVFTSIQGEGLYTGAAMTFFRFAGCTVGRPYTAEARTAIGLSVYQERCSNWDGQGFACDTNYRKAEYLSVPQLMERVYAPRVLLTGGEPLMHDLGPLVSALLAAGLRVHLETSGTIAGGILTTYPGMWVTVSPKAGYRAEVLARADEIKVLVDHSFSEERFLHEFGKSLDIVWVQPVNREHEIDRENLARCIALIKRHPRVRLSSQAHKYWKVR